MAGLQLTGQVGPGFYSTNANPFLRQSQYGELVTHEASGQFLEQAVNGRMFVYTAPAQAILLTNTTGNNLTIWNPAGSNTLFVPLSLTIAYVSGTLVVGSVVIATTLNAGSAIGTAAPLPTATLVAAKPSVRGGKSGASVMNFAPTTVTFTAAPTVEYATSINYCTTATGGPATGREDFNGKLAYYPGSAMTVCYSVTTSTALFIQSVVGLEIPLAPGQ